MPELVAHFYGMRLWDQKIEENYPTGQDPEALLEQAYLMEASNQQKSRKSSQILFRQSLEAKQEKQKECVKSQTSWAVTSTALAVAALSVTSGLLTGSSCFVRSEGTQTLLRSFSKTAEGFSQGGSQGEKILENRKKKSETLAQFGKSDAEDCQKRADTAASEASQQAQKNLSRASEIAQQKLRSMS